LKLSANNQPNNYYLGLGSNINPEHNLQIAVSRLQKCCPISKISHVYKTHAEGSNGPDFLNAVLLVKSFLDPDDLKKEVLQGIENTLGRKRTTDKNAPRTIDLDVLLQNNMILDPNIWSRVYIAVPLAELVPNLKDEFSGHTLKIIASLLRKQYYIEKIHPFQWDAF
jgi:2-amino-4-hydroxy-6-hydroxymethyldihydropteridine diphosphokinase